MPCSVQLGAPALILATVCLVPISVAKLYEFAVMNTGGSVNGRVVEPSAVHGVGILHNYQFLIFLSEWKSIVGIYALAPVAPLSRPRSLQRDRGAPRPNFLRILCIPTQ